MNLLDFGDHEYINLITYKKDNTSVKTPVWVAKHENYLVITSSKSAGKVKRINNNGRATIYVTDQIGSSTLSDPLDVNASIIDDKENKQAALDKIIKKYGSMSKMFIRGSNENRAIIKIQEKE
jgi:PPOX class probable F420-dependent enzyme|tara:strand:+ start:81 stop:449 length:369 start_codon:yes stop_codon:yes gene_type:complete